MKKTFNTTQVEDTIINVNLNITNISIYERFSIDVYNGGKASNDSKLLGNN